jgi:Leucine-rich repeat (LRR) protein
MKNAELNHDGVFSFHDKRYWKEYVAFQATQIKSAIGNNGEFSPTNPDIRFSRAEENSNSIEPTQESDNKKLNSLLHGWLGGKGEKTYEAVSSSVRGFLSRMPSSMALVNNTPPAFKQMMREMIRDSKQAELTVSDILKNSTSLKAEERTLLSDYLEKELALGITPPEDVVKVGAAMRMALSYQTDELVRLGMLSTESAARWRDTYLPRMYKEKKKDPITQAIVKRFDIKGEHLKGRGQFKEVDSSEVPNDVFNQTNLVELNISNNQLTGSLQAEIRHLQNLRVLKASNNHMTGVPAEIGQLTKLEILDLSNNQLTGLPNELGNLKNLKTFNISGNKYSEQDLQGIIAHLPASVHVIK